jgi:hypothetical protein
MRGSYAEYKQKGYGMALGSEEMCSVRKPLGGSIRSQDMLLAM